MTRPTDWNGSTLLDTLGLRRLDLVLEEAFGVPPREIFPELARPTTVGELAASSRWSVDKVMRRLKEVLVLEQGLEITIEALQELIAATPSPLLLDVREEWEFDICRLPGAILLANADFPSLLTTLQEAEAKGVAVVTICHHGVRSYSAALYLREKGVKHARSLTGGVDLWALTVDGEMARY